MINGTGKIYQKTLWLNAADRSLDNVKAFEKKKGKLILAFNDWHTYFDVRVNQLELRGAIKDNLHHLIRERKFLEKPFKKLIGSIFFILLICYPGLEQKLQSSSGL